MTEPKQPKRVLIVDDDKELLKLMAGVFAHRGYAVETMEHGLGVIHRLTGGVAPTKVDPFDDPSVSRPPPDIVVLDNYLPEISGIAILNLAVRTRGATDVPVVLYSSDATVETQLIATRHPHAHFLLKGSILKLVDFVDAVFAKK